MINNAVLSEANPYEPPRLSGLVEGARDSTVAEVDEGEACRRSPEGVAGGVLGLCRHHGTSRAAPELAPRKRVQLEAIDEAIIAQLEPRLFRYAIRKTGREELARELVQETWLAALTSLEKFEGRSSLLTWLTSILHRKHVDTIRRSRPSAGLDSLPELAAPASGRDPVDDRAAVALVAEALGKLSPKERRAVLLCDVEDVARNDAAEVLNVGRETLRVLLHRGRKRLRGALEQAGFESAS